MRSHRLRPISFVLPIATIALSMLTFLALGAGAALAATPIDLGPSAEGPHLAIDAAGAGSLTWVNGTEVLQYCRLDPGAGSCSASHVFPEITGFATNEGNTPLIVGSAVDVLSARYKSEEDKFLYSSTNGFSTPTTIATTTGAPGSSAGFTQALYAPAGTLNATLATIPTVLDGTEGAVFQATNTTGTTAGSFYLSETPTAERPGVISSAIALQGKVLVSAYTLSSNNEIYWRRYNGPASSTPANLNNKANWKAQVALTQGGDDIAMTSGPRGIYIAYDSPSNNTVLIQRFNEFTESWEAPDAVTEPGITLFGISEDAAGIVHVAYVNQLEGVLHYTYARDASNILFTNPQSLATGSIRDPKVATTAAGNGWVTWEDQGDRHAMAIPIALGEPLSPGPPPPPPVTPPAAPPGKKGGAGTTKTTTKPIVPGLNATLSTPKLCINGGAAFKAKVAVKKKGTKAKKLSYSVKQVKFSIAGKLITTDTKKPFEATLHGSRRAGASIPVAAKISVQLKKGHRHSTVTKTLTATVTSCK